MPRQLGLLCLLMTIGLNVTTHVSGDDGWKADEALIKKLSASRKNIIYDESQVPAYTLPDPLTRDDGAKLTEANQWPAHRERTMELFRANMYGRRPTLDYKLSFTTNAEATDVLGTGGNGRSMTITVTSKGDSFSFPMYVFLPAASSLTKGKAPAIVLINNRTFPTFESVTTTEDGFWPVKEILQRGYATCAISTVTIDPDRADGFNEGIRGFFHRLSGNAQAKPADDAWKALSAWGWGASRALDYLHTLDSIDTTKVGLIGHSRGGKTALWAAAEDPRFTAVCSNNSGCGGAALTRRMYGETIERITTNFPHWFCDRLNSYIGKEETLPIDQHQLFAMIAPRPVYATSATEDLWADPRGEFLSMVAAAPVYRFVNEQGFTSDAMPPADKPRVEGKMGYHIRTGPHDLKAYDWACFMDFCDQQWQR